MELFLSPSRDTLIFSRDILLIHIGGGYDSREIPPVSYHGSIYATPQEFKPCSPGEKGDESEGTLSAVVFHENNVVKRIRSSPYKWIFLMNSVISDDEDFLVWTLKQCIREASFQAAIFDERLPEDASLLYANMTDTLIRDVLHDSPSNLLIRRDVLLDILTQEKECFYPFPIEKIIRYILQSGIKLHYAHRFLCKKETVSSPIFFPYRLHHSRSTSWDKNRKILVITHELTRTGAPLVLAEACINVLKKHGYQMLVVSPDEGPVAQMYLDNGISVMIQPKLLSNNDQSLLRIAPMYDLVMVCTSVPYACIAALNGLNIPVLWWIHECEEGYRYVKKFLPSSLYGNVHVYCGGQYALDVLYKYFPSYNGKMLLYGIQDRNPEAIPGLKKDSTRLRFSIVGSVVWRKGQDILAQAIDLLDASVRNQCEFLFVGSVNDPSIFKHIEKAVKKYPENVKYRANIPRDELDDVYRNTDCIICASRDDPMPAFVTEGMMFGKPAICSRFTGTADVIIQGNSGYVYENNAARQLADSIELFVRLKPEERQVLCQNARKCYETYFSLPVFERDILSAVHECME